MPFLPAGRDQTIVFDPGAAAPPPGSAPLTVLRRLLASSLVLPEDWEQLTVRERERLQQAPDRDALLAGLVELRLLSGYQAARVQAGKVFGLVLGNYRVLERIGAGGMGVVFQAEHIVLRRLVAIKVVPLAGAEEVSLYPGEDTTIRSRFYAEMRTVARLQHPNIVAVFDAGTMHSADPTDPVLHYFAMEYVPGVDLEQHVKAHGPMSAPQACDVVHQIASALVETSRHGLIHRDIKPSNVLTTTDGSAKLLDFGLARQWGGTSLTQQGMILGTVDFMPPEQVQDPSAVDVRADIFALGGTLYWCLTGEKPFPSHGNTILDLSLRLKQQAPTLQGRGLPEGLDRVVRRMMALRPEDRYQTPQEILQALLPFLRPDSRDDVLTTAARACAPAALAAAAREDQPRKSHRVLIVDDDKQLRMFCRHILEGDYLDCDEAGDGAAALAMVPQRPYDLVLLDVNMPGLSGLEVCGRLREGCPHPHLKVLLFSGETSVDEMAKMLLSGADECMTKPFSMVHLRSRVRALLRLKDAQDRSDQLNQHLQRLNEELERHLEATDADLLHVRNSLVLALARVVEYRESENGAHLVRVQRYCRALAESAGRLPEFAGLIDPHFVQMLECCAPLHDIGKMALPDHILLKPGKLDPEERVLMQTHTTIGADALAEIAAQNSSALGFLQMAIDIARHHHERHDGQGYPDGLRGDETPLAAQFVHLADVYDGLRTRRSYKPGLSHGAAVQLITEGSPGQFSPQLITAFRGCAAEFERIHAEEGKRRT